LLAFDIIILASAHAYYSHWFNDHEWAVFLSEQVDTSNGDEFAFITGA
jgi:hypothetical protein